MSAANVRAAHRTALPALGPRQPFRLLHFDHLDGRRRDRRGRADRRAVGDERLRARAARSHPEPDLARDDQRVRCRACRTGEALAESARRASGSARGCAVHRGPGAADRRRQEQRCRRHRRAAGGRAQGVGDRARRSRSGSFDALQPGGYGIVLGAELAQALGVSSRRPRRGGHLAAHDARRRASCRACAASRSSARSPRACTSSTAISPTCTWRMPRGCIAWATRSPGCG